MSSENYSENTELLVKIMSRLERFGVKMHLEIDYASHHCFKTLILMVV